MTIIFFDIFINSFKIYGDFMSKFQRLEFIKQRLFSQRKLSLKDVIKEFNVDKRTVYRDIKELKKANFPIKWDRNKEAYVLSSSEIEELFLEEKNLLFYTFIESLSNNQIYVPFVIKEVLDNLREKLAKDYKKLLCRIKYECEEYNPIDLEKFKTFIEGILQKKKIKIKYEDKKGEISERMVEPLYFINYSSQWYFIAYDHKSEEIRNFNSGRIIEASISDENCKYYIDIHKLENYIKTSFGIYKGRYVKRVKIRFYEPVYYVVKNQIWHKEQEKIEYKNSNEENILELTIPVGDYEEIIGKILRYLPYAEAIEPEDFRREWLDRIRNGAKRFL